MNLQSNIQETSKGIKYAYDKEKGYTQECIAICREYDETFSTTFYSPKSYNYEQLMSIGEELALLWGATCLQVETNT